MNCVRVVLIWIGAGLLLTYALHCNSGRQNPTPTPSFSPDLQSVTFTGRVLSIQPMNQYSGSLVASELDPRFAVRFAIVADSIPDKFKAGREIYIGVHSIALAFASPQENVIGRVIEMRLSVVSMKEPPVYRLVPVQYVTSQPQDLESPP